MYLKTHQPGSQSLWMLHIVTLLRHTPNTVHHCSDHGSRIGGSTIIILNAMPSLTMQTENNKNSHIHNCPFQSVTIAHFTSAFYLHCPLLGSLVLASIMIPHSPLVGSLVLVPHGVPHSLLMGPLVLVLHLLLHCLLLGSLFPLLCPSSPAQPVSVLPCISQYIVLAQSLVFPT